MRIRRHESLSAPLPNCKRITQTPRRRRPPAGWVLLGTRLEQFAHDVLVRFVFEDTRCGVHLVPQLFVAHALVATEADAGALHLVTNVLIESTGSRPV